MSVYFDKSKKRWRFSFNRIVGVTRHRATKLLPPGWSQRQAEAYDREKCGSLYAQATGVEKPRLRLAPAVTLYLDHRCPELKNGKKTAQDLAHLNDYIENAWLDQVDDVAAKYTKANAHLAPATLHNRLAYLKAAVRYARRVHKYGKGLPDSTADMVMPEVHNERQVYAKLPQLKALWGAFEDADTAALFTLNFYLGTRWRAELLTREPKHVHRNGRQVWLEIGITKNGNPVMKPVHPAAVPCLKFIPFTRSDSYYYDRWHAATKKIGRPDLKPHDLRHSLASEVLSRPGGTLDDVRAALHQVSVQSSQRYAHLYPERMRAIMMATGGRKNAHRKKSKKKAA